VLSVCVLPVPGFGLDYVPETVFFLFGLILVLIQLCWRTPSSDRGWSFSHRDTVIRDREAPAAHYPQGAPSETRSAIYSVARLLSVALTREIGSEVVMSSLATVLSSARRGFANYCRLFRGTLAESSTMIKVYMYSMNSSGRRANAESEAEAAT
jgi:hypothetical protein